MRKLVLLFVFVFAAIIGNAQSTEGSKYLEDQLYLTLSYDILTNAPKAFDHNGFSGSFSTGFIKDIPVNESRNFGFGLGLGYGYSAFIQNMKIESNNGNITFEPIDSYKKNWLKEHKLEMPIEIRFRGSTPNKYKFWRVYTGIKLSYVLASKSKFENECRLWDNYSTDYKPTLEFCKSNEIDS